RYWGQPVLSGKLQPPSGLGSQSPSSAGKSQIEIEAPDPLHLKDRLWSFYPEIAQHRKVIRIEVAIDPVAQNGGFRGLDFIVGENVIDSIAAFFINVETCKSRCGAQRRVLRSGISVVKRRRHFLNSFGLRWQIEVT